jgi:hypothetical protein
VVLGSAVVVVGTVVVGAAVVVGVVVGGAAVVVGGAAVVVGAVTGGWVVAAPKVENVSVLVVVPAVAGAWTVPDLGVVGALLTARPGLVSEVGVERVGAVVGCRGPVVGVDTALAAGSAGTIDSAMSGAWPSGGG